MFCCSAANSITSVTYFSFSSSSWLWPQARLTRDHQSQETAEAGVLWSAWRDTYFDSAGCPLSVWRELIIDCDSWSCDITLWSIPCHTYLDFVDLLRRLLTKINRCHACLVSTLHWAQQSAEAGHTLCGQTFHSSPAFQTPQEFGEKSLMASNLATCYDVVHCNII